MDRKKIIGFKSTVNEKVGSVSAGAIALRNGYFLTNEHVTEGVIEFSLRVRIWSENNDAHYYDVVPVKESKGRDLSLLCLRSVWIVRNQGKTSTLEQVSKALSELQVFKDSIVDIKPPPPGTTLDSGVQVYSFSHHSRQLYSFVSGWIAYSYNYGVSEITSRAIEDLDQFTHIRDEILCHDEMSFRNFLETGIFRQETNRSYIFKDQKNPFIHPHLPVIQISGSMVRKGGSGCPFFRMDNNEFIGLVSFSDSLESYAFLIPVDHILSFLNKHGASEFMAHKLYENIQRYLLKSKKKAAHDIHLTPGSSGGSQRAN